MGLGLGERGRGEGWGEGRKGTLPAEGQTWGKKTENWPAGLGEVACMQCRMHSRGGTGRDLKIWLQLNHEGLLHKPKESGL